ncbi:NAD(P)-binding protein [Heliocybe sulcata]|uniref:NAD(P)-binding protein n=1 Tax=Heliocybe sulcata TaxID=5364 RepID=A0A5C3N2K0_9AGAM|nr:NAD(P)-binding protein [Heliocybe sulcata]
MSTKTNAIAKSTTGAPPLGVSADLTGKTVVVVGANTGIGLAAAKLFATMKASKVVLACRTQEKGKKAVAEVEETTGTKSAELWLVDLAKFSSVVDFADRWEKKATWEETEGWESTLHVNHLSTVLCALLLLPRLLKTASQFSAHTRLVIVSSGAHRATVNEYLRNSPNILKALNDKEKGHLTSRVGPAPMQDLRCNISKLLNIFFTRSLVARLGSTSPVIVSAISPVYCTFEQRIHPRVRDLIEVPILVEQDGKLVPLPERTSEEGAYQLLWAALGPPNPDEIDSIRGAYVYDNQIVSPGEFVLGEDGKESQERIWDETIDGLSGPAPQIKEIVNQYLHYK